ncbi:MAG: 16S rRNA (cytidine(1402)-2'-O)-methyltransferase [Eubacteriales bacterium]
MNNSILYIVATPIGNLGDITFRAVDTLKTVDMVAAEDTRRTIKLLNHLEIKTPMLSYHQHNRNQAGEKILSLLSDGKSVALVTDAGMPCISDPGYELVRDARKSGFSVECIPGACAAVTALALSGFDSTYFVFEGFLPKESKLIKQRLSFLQNEKRPIILYETPHRLEKTIKLLSNMFSDRQICLANEITKLHEKVIIDTAEEISKLLSDNPARGEYVIIIDKSGEEEKENWDDMEISTHIKSYIDGGMSKMDAVKAVAKDRNMPKSEIYPYSLDL